MNPLSALYGSTVHARNSLYDHGIFKPHRLSWPVVSVGNISVGGSGKTPFVIMLGGLLAARGIGFDVLSRGYGRSTGGVLKVNASGTSDEFGDEPLLIARKLNCPIVVGPSRYAAGLLAERESAADASSPIHLLDDGFQHRQLHRDFNIVLINDDDVRDSLLPSGRMREPISSIRRADAVIVSEPFPVDRLPAGKFRIWRIRRKSDVPDLKVPVIAFCGIARPERFFADLRQHGLEVRQEVRFRDHHRYTDAEVARLLAAKSKIPGAQLVTTEKDAINLGVNLDRVSPSLVPMRLELDEAESFVEHLLGVIAGRRRSCN
jgi:tetraacyldisaccharide 4'-kinase